MIPGVVASQESVIEEPEPGVSVSWNPSDKHADITLSDSDRVATNTATDSYRAVRATLARDSGLRYFECRPLAIGTDFEMAPVGLMTITAVLDNYLGSGTGADFTAGVFADGSVYADDVFVGSTISSVGVGEWIGLLVDLDAGKAWARYASGWDGDPRDGDDPTFTFTPGSNLYPGTNLYGLSDAVEFNGGHAAFAYDTKFPVGATAWNGSEIVNASEGTGLLNNLSEDASFAWSMSRALLSSYVGSLYTDAGGGEISHILDQTGRGNDLVAGGPTARPDVSTSGPNNIVSAHFDGVNHQLPQSTSNTLDDMLGLTSFYVVVLCVVNSPNTNNVVVSLNQCVWMDTGGDVGFFVKDAPSGHAVIDNGGGTELSTDHVSFPVGTPVVIETKRDGGVLSSRVNGGAWQVHGTTVTANNPTATRFRMAGNGLVFTDLELMEGFGFMQPLETAEEDALVASLKTYAGI